jgi:hypothetical protein
MGFSLKSITSFKLKRKLQKLQHISLFGGLTFVFVILSVLLLVYFAQIKLQEIQLNNTIEKKEQLLLTKQNQLRQITTTESYKRYISTKTFLDQVTFTPWKENLDYMISLFELLQAFDDKESEFSLDNIQVQPTRISMRGQISSLDIVYRSGGLLDRFLSFSFVDKVKIPYYKKSGDQFSFILEADVKRDDGS